MSISEMQGQVTVSSNIRTRLRPLNPDYNASAKGTGT